MGEICDRCGCLLTTENRINNLCKTCDYILTIEVKLDNIKRIYEEWSENDKYADEWAYQKIGEVIKTWN